MTNLLSVHESFSLFLKTLGRHYFSLVYPIVSEEKDKEKLLEHLLCEEEFPEQLLRNVIKMVNLVGWQTSQEFEKVKI